MAQPSRQSPPPPSVPDPEDVSTEAAAPGRATGEALKRAILDEARRRLVDDGFAGLSTRKIARAVGCTATSIYLYFRNKDALVHALVEEGFERMNARVLGAAEDAGRETGSRHARVGAAARAVVAFALENPSYYEIMFQLPLDRVERLPTEIYRQARRPLDSFVEISGLPRDEALLRGTTLLATLHGLVALVLGKRIDNQVDVEVLIRATIESAVRASLEGLAPDDSAHDTPNTTTP